MIGRLNHVGVATPSISASVKFYREVLGAVRIGEKFLMSAEGVWVCFVDLENAQIELLEPFDDGSALTSFLKAHPAGGQHHICYEVADLLISRDEMVRKGVRVLGEPRIGAHGTLIVFLHPKDMGGVLVELMQKP